jgi:hypothetical protein
MTFSSAIKNGQWCKRLEMNNWISFNKAKCSFVDRYGKDYELSPIDLVSDDWEVNKEYKSIKFLTGLEALTAIKAGLILSRSSNVVSKNLPSSTVISLVEGKLISYQWDNRFLLRYRGKCGFVFASDFLSDDWFVWDIQD